MYMYIYIYLFCLYEVLFLVNAKKYKIFKSQNHNAFFQEKLFSAKLKI